MFGKIKNKLKGVFDKSEEIVEENPDEVVDVEQPQGETKVHRFSKTPKEDKKSSEEEKLAEDKQKKKENLSDEVNSQESKEFLESGEEETPQEKKKGFFSKVFSRKKDEEESKEATKIQEEMLSEVPGEEKEAIKEHKELSVEEVEKNKKRLEEQESQELENEKETLSSSDVDSTQTFEKKSKDSKKTSFEKAKTKEDVEVSDGTSKREDDSIYVPEPEDTPSQEDGGFFSKTFSKLKKKKITQDDFDKIWLDLEIFLLEINVAYEIVEKIEAKLERTLLGNSFDRFQLSNAIRDVLVSEVENVLREREGDFLDEIHKHKTEGSPLKIMMLGVNGTGKTTSIAKIIHYLQNQNFSVVVAAADTFRAAAVDQLQEHSKKLGVKCITHKHGSDPAAVAYDAVDHAKAKNIDVVLIDTAGRMPNNSNLMNELQKIKRVSESQMALFIGDSIAGNDLIDQISLFDKGIGVDGVVLTKVDTDERPGSVVTTAYAIEKPIYFLGTGQGYSDLVEFNAKHVAEALFDTTK